MVKENIKYNARLIGKLRMVNISLIFVPPECLGKRKYSELIIVVKIIIRLKFLNLLRGPARGGSHVASLNFETSRVGVYYCLTSLSEIE